VEEVLGSGNGLRMERPRRGILEDMYYERRRAEALED
jgi:hypothetical protein